MRNESFLFRRKVTKNEDEDASDPDFCRPFGTHRAPRGGGDSSNNSRSLQLTLVGVASSKRHRENPFFELP